MSTILKALKRLETEQEPQQTDGAVSTGAFNARKALHRQSVISLFRSRMVLWLIIALLFIVGIITVSGFLLLQPKKERDTIQATPEKRVKPRRSIAANASGPSSNPASFAQSKSRDPLLAKPSSSIKRPAARLPEAVAHSASHADQPLARQTSPSQGVAPKMARLQAGATPVVGNESRDTPTTSQSQGTAAKTNTMPKKAPSAVERQEDPYAGAQRLTDGRLKVQAIAWAPESTERMAVVNNRIVREGGNLEGFFIVGIGKEAVFVREDGRLLKVPFGKP